MLDRAEPARNTTTEAKHPVMETETNPLSAQTSVTVREPTTTDLKGSVYALLVVGLYTGLALAAWVILCITSKRPIRGAKSYTGVQVYKPKPGFLINERYIETAAVLQNIVLVLTIPVTSAVCSMAAVVYMQSVPMRKSLNVRQLMALADQGWISPRIWARIFRVGSAPLYIAFALTLIGSVSQILQASFVDRENIRVPSQSSFFDTLSIKDIPAELSSELGYESGKSVHTLRRMLDVITMDDIDANIWSPEAPIPNPKLSSLTESAFFSEVPSNFSTGLLGPQYAPRMNSTTNVTVVSEEEFRGSCRDESNSGGFYVQYQKTYGYVERDYYMYSLTVCMPGDIRISPWKPTRDRQDITEELYINITLANRAMHYRVRTQSSLGYFELPNIMNGNKPGPLLQQDPYPNKTLPSRFRYDHLFSNAKRDELLNITNAGNETLITVLNQAPLALLAQALFGNGSYIETRIRSPEAYIDSRPNWQGDDRRPNTWMCVDVLPFSGVLGSRCVTSWDISRSLDGIIRMWLDSMRSITVLQKVMTMGVRAATKNWLGPQNARGTLDRSIGIYTHEGFETFKTKMSNEQMIVGSVLLGVHLLGLWTLAIIATLTFTWTRTLGAEAMLKVGMAHAVHLSTAENSWKHQAGLLPGYIGDARPAGPIGRMEMGATHKLVHSRKYELLK